MSVVNKHSLSEIKLNVERGCGVRFFLVAVSHCHQHTYKICNIRLALHEFLAQRHTSGIIILIWRIAFVAKCMWRLVTEGTFLFVPDFMDDTFASGKCKPWMSNGRWCLTPDDSANSFLQWNRLKFVDQVDVVKPLRWMLGGLAMQKSIKHILEIPYICRKWEKIVWRCWRQATGNRSKDAFGLKRILIRRILHKCSNLNNCLCRRSLRPSIVLYARRRAKNSATATYKAGIRWTQIDK